MATPLEQKSSIETIRARFDQDVERFSNLETGQSATIDAPLAMELITQAALATTPHVKKVLDVGCGAGNNSLKLLLEADRDLDIDLLDLSRPMLDRAFQRVSEKTNGQVRIFQTDLRVATLTPGSYDVILAAAVLHHLREEKDWRHAFEKLYDLLRPGGSLWITDFISHDVKPIQDLMWIRYGAYLEKLGGEAYREKVFAYTDKEDSPRSVLFQLDLLRAAGFPQVELLHKNSCFAAFGAIK